MKYKRVLLKLSGEALSENSSGILNFDIVKDVCEAIKKCVDKGIEVAVVVGAGNIWRGRSGGYMDRTKADNMGMLATIINSIALQDTLISIGTDAKVITSMEIPGITELYSKDLSVKALESGNVVIFGGGLGQPYFSTDTAAVLRAIEVECDAALFAKNVDGIYSDDPGKNPDAVRYDKLSYAEILEKRLRAIDLTAAALAMDNDLPILVFGLDDTDNIVRAASGENRGTLLGKEF